MAGSVRAQATLVAVLVVGAALVVGGIALVLALGRILRAGVETAALLRAEEIAAIIETGDRPPVLAVAEQDEQLIQVLDHEGVVVASSRNVRALPPVVRLAPGEKAEIEVPIDEEVFLAVAAGAETPRGTLTVIVARALGDVIEATRVLASLLAAGIPLLTLLVATTTWRLVGRALRPVEAIRREVDQISGSELHRRVPAPPERDEIGRLAATMNRMLDRLERAQLRLRRFIADASHELRSPVATIRQHAEVALAHPERATMAELAETVLAEDLRLQGLVDDLLVLAKADEHTLDLHRRPVDLDDLVFEEARHLRASSGHQIDTSAVSAGRVSADPAALRRVLRNLADNATRAARTRISLGLSELDGLVVLTVDDDGPGIPATERERVFERFVRLDESRARNDGGNGLGLAIVAELVAAHGGSVAIAEGDLGGARFVVTLPVLSEDPAT
jgi:signal transduction histidine kinase